MRLFLATLVCGLVLAVSNASAHDMKHGEMMVEHPWARASAGPAKAGAAYMVLSNMGHDTDRLIGAKSMLADRTEVHNHIMDNGIMKMRQVDAIEVAPGTPTILQPGGLHIMFMGLHKPFIEGQKLPMTLVFEKAGEIDIEFIVQGVSAKQPGHDMDMKNSHGHSHGS